MIKVYFETENFGYCEMVAIFDSEESYHTCLPALKKLAKKNGFAHITESVQNISLHEADDIIEINSTKI